jgi:hypothetical protein
MYQGGDFGYGQDFRIGNGCSSRAIRGIHELIYIRLLEKVGWQIHH